MWIFHVFFVESWGAPGEVKSSNQGLISCPWSFWEKIDHPTILFLSVPSLKIGNICDWLHSVVYILGMKDRKLSLQKFSARGGAGILLQKKKEAETVKRMKKASALRKYAKLCKRDGIVSDRVNVDGVRKAESGDGREVKQPAKAEMRKISAVEKEAQKSLENKMELEQARKKVEDEIKLSEAARLDKRREVMMRHKNGQPLLNLTAKKLLEKIQTRL